MIRRRLCPWLRGARYLADRGIRSDWTHRVRPQLSRAVKDLAHSHQQPTFHRLVQRPERAGELPVGVLAYILRTAAAGVHTHNERGVRPIGTSEMLRTFQHEHPVILQLQAKLREQLSAECLCSP